MRSFECRGGLACPGDLACSGERLHRCVPAPSRWSGGVEEFGRDLPGIADLRRLLDVGENAREHADGLLVLGRTDVAEVAGEVQKHALLRRGGTLLLVLEPLEEIADVHPE